MFDFQWSHSFAFFCFFFLIYQFLPAALCLWGWLSLKLKWIPGILLGRRVRLTTSPLGAYCAWKCSRCELFLSFAATKVFTASNLRNLVLYYRGFILESQILFVGNDRLKFRRNCLKRNSLILLYRVSTNESPLFWRCFENRQMVYFRCSDSNSHLNV
jgi:hypothetical protein